VVGSDATMDDTVVHEFNLVLADDPAHNPDDPTSSTQDVVRMLDGWHRDITGWRSTMRGTSSSTATATSDPARLRRHQRIQRFLQAGLGLFHRRSILRPTTSRLVSVAPTPY
jgi:hypothetical protein